MGKRQGEAGAIVDGAVRDIGHSREIGYPVWSTSVSPMTGKWRIRTVTVNRPVPFARAAEVLAVAQRLVKREEDRLAKLGSGMPLKDWIKL